MATEVLHDQHSYSGERNASFAQFIEALRRVGTAQRQPANPSAACVINPRCYAAVHLCVAGASG